VIKPKQTDKDSPSEKARQEQRASRYTKRKIRAIVDDSEDEEVVPVARSRVARAQTNRSSTGLFVSEVHRPTHTPPMAEHLEPLSQQDLELPTSIGPEAEKNPTPKDESVAPSESTAVPPESTGPRDDSMGSNIIVAPARKKPAPANVQAESPEEDTTTSGGMLEDTPAPAATPPAADPPPAPVQRQYNTRSHHTSNNSSSNDNNQEPPLLTPTSIGASRTPSSAPTNTSNLTTTSSGPKGMGTIGTIIKQMIRLHLAETEAKLAKQFERKSEEMEKRLMERLEKRLERLMDIGGQSGDQGLKERIKGEILDEIRAGLL
jgi:hypothetical protein